MIDFIKIILLIIFNSGALYSGEVVSGSRRVVPNQNPSGGPGRIYQDKCYGYLKSVTVADKEDTSLGLIKSNYGTCRMNTTTAAVQKTFGSGENFVKYLQSDRYKNLGEENKFDYSRCAKDQDVEPFEIASKYYYMLNRVKEGQESHLSQISAMSQIIGDDKFSQLGCSKSNLPEVKKLCDDLSKCKARPDKLEQLASLTEATLGRIEFIKKAIGEKSAESLKYAGNIEKRNEIYADINALKIQIGEEKLQVPWIGGDEYKKAISRHDSIGEAIRKQLVDDRKRTIASFFDTERDKRCILGTQHLREICNSDRLSEIGERTPHTGMTSKIGSAENREKDSLVNSELYAQSCLFEAKVDQLNTSHVINMAFLEAGAGLLTMGLSSSATITRFLAGRALMSEKVAENVAKAGNIGRVGMDAGMFVKNATDAAHACQAFAAAGQTEKAQDSCEVPSVYSVTPASTSYTSCMFALSFAAFDVARLGKGQMWAALNAKKVTQLDEATQKRLANFLEIYQKEKTAGTKNAAEVAAGKLVNKTEVLNAAAELGTDNLARFKAAEGVIGREVPTAQRRAILAAHEVAPSKGYFDYTQKELREKYEILEKAGFTKQEINKLMRTGVTGKMSSTGALVDAKGLAQSELASPTTRDELSEYYSELETLKTRQAAVDKTVAALQRSATSTDGQLIVVNRRIKLLEEGKVKPTSSTEIDDLKKKREALTTSLAEFREKSWKIDTEGKLVRASDMARTRGFIAETTTDIERLEQEMVQIKRKGSAGFENSNDFHAALNLRVNSIARKIQERRTAFEEEAQHMLESDPTHFQQAIVPLRRSTKDINQTTFKSNRSVGEIQSEFSARALGQDTGGISGASIQSYAKALNDVHIDSIANGRPLLRANDLAPAIKKTLQADGGNSEIWKAYVNFAQRSGDQTIVMKLMQDSKPILAKKGISPNEFATIEEKYVAAKSKAASELKDALTRVYKGTDTASSNKIQKLFEELTSW